MASCESKYELYKIKNLKYMGENWRKKQNRNLKKKRGI